MKNPKCEWTEGCERKPDSVIRTKQVSLRVGAGPMTEVWWFIDDVGDAVLRQGTQLCAEHRDAMLARLGEVL
jgi:hypothetical protein